MGESPVVKPATTGRWRASRNTGSHRRPSSFLDVVTDRNSAGGPANRKAFPVHRLACCRLSAVVCPRHLSSPFLIMRLLSNSSRTLSAVFRTTWFLSCSRFTEENEPLDGRLRSRRGSTGGYCWHRGNRQTAGRESGTHLSLLSWVCDIRLWPVFRQYWS